MESLRDATTKRRSSSRAASLVARAISRTRASASAGPRLRVLADTNRTRLWRSAQRRSSTSQAISTGTPDTAWVPVGSSSTITSRTPEASITAATWAAVTSGSGGAPARSAVTAGRSVCRLMP